MKKTIRNKHNSQLASHVSGCRSRLSATHHIKQIMLRLNRQYHGNGGLLTLLVLLFCRSAYALPGEFDLQTHRIISAQIKPASRKDGQQHESTHKVILKLQRLNRPDVFVNELGNQKLSSTIQLSEADVALLQRDLSVKKISLENLLSEQMDRNHHAFAEVIQSLGGIAGRKQGMVAYAGGWRSNRPALLNLRGNAMRPRLENYEKRINNLIDSHLNDPEKYPAKNVLATASRELALLSLEFTAHGYVSTGENFGGIFDPWHELHPGYSTADLSSLSMREADIVRSLITRLSEINLEVKDIQTLKEWSERVGDNPEFLSDSLFEGINLGDVLRVNQSRPQQNSRQRRLSENTRNLIKHVLNKRTD